MRNNFLKSAVGMVLAVSMLITGIPFSVSAKTTENVYEENYNTDFEQNNEVNRFEEIERNTEIILRNPNLYTTIEGTDIKGAEVWHDQCSRTYFMEDGTYLTRYFDEPIMYTDDNGELRDIDNTLKSQGNNYVNSENSYELILPKEGEGITIENKGHTFSLIPVFGELKNGVVKENAIRYNNILDGVDLQYTANGSNVKEDIIINKPVEVSEFSYEIECSNLNLQIKNNVLYAYEKGSVEPVFVITAPYMSDNSGITSQAVDLSLEKINGRQLLTVSPDMDWINAEERAYPVIIDPVIELGKSNLEWCLVENGQGNGERLAGPDVEHTGNPYLYVGWEKGNLIGYEGMYYNQTRSYIKINYDFTDIPDEAIISAKLKAYKYMGSPPEGTNVYCDLVTSDWRGTTKCWNTQPTETVRFAEPADVSLEPKWVEWDISAAVAYWKQGNTNYGLVLTPEDESQGAVVFSGPGNKDGQQAMYFDISWTVPNAVDENMALDTPVINLRPLTETHSSGIQSLNGVFADGVVRPTLSVSYRLNNSDKGVYSSADYGKKYPDSSLFAGSVKFTMGYSNINVSNWQSKVFTGLKTNTLYRVYATASNGTETTPEGASDSFIVYKFTSQDVLPKIADFYGVSLNQIIIDNRPKDYLGFEGNTYFIRNPKRNATVPYTTPDSITDAHKREIIYANLGRGLHSEYDLEPVNVNIGNYYFSSIDAQSKEYNGTFSLERSYNSIGDMSYGVFGKGWSFEYAQKLSGNSDGNIVYAMGDGKELVFEWNGSKYVSPSGYYLELVKHTGAALADSYYTITQTDGTVYRFNCYGMLEKITDRNGFVTTVLYDGNYHISGIVTASGRQYVISTNTDGQIVSVTLPNGGVLRYEYSDGGLVKYTNADNETVRYKYNSNGQMTEWYDGNNNRVIANTYDSKGRIITQTDALGSTSRLSYSDGRTVVTDSQGSKTTYYYDSLYRTTKVEGADTNKESEYNGNNQLASLTVNDIQTTYQYDSKGNITKEIRTDGAYRELKYDEYGNATYIREYDGGITYNEYDSKGNLVKTVKADGSINTYTYDKYGQVTSLTDGNGNTTTFVYSGLTKMTMTDGNGNTSVCIYDSMGQLVSEKDALGNEVKTIYSKNGKKLGVWKTGDIYEQYLYDGNGNCIEVVDAEGYKSVFTYDSANRMLTAKNPLGGIISYTYDSNGNRIKETDVNNNTTEYEYDSNNRLITTKDSLGRITSRSYNEYGQLETVQTPDGNTTVYEYDSIHGLVIKITDNTGSIVYKYDVMGRLCETIYPDGSSEQSIYNEMGYVIRFVDRNGLVTDYQYDLNGNVKTVSDSMGGELFYKYDGLNNVIEAVNSLGHKISYEYDKASRLISQTDANGNITKYCYDSVGNITEIINANGVAVKYSYDRNGNCTAITDGNANITRYSYNGNGDLIAVVDALNNATTYQYDNAQNLISVTNKAAKSILYEYDSLGRLIQTTDEDGYTTLTEYDDRGNVSSITAPNGSKTLYTYNDNNQLVKAETADGLITEYEYDLMGRVIKEADNAGNIKTSNYDEAGQLIAQADSEGRRAEYTYDKYGNVTKLVDYNGDITLYEYDVLSRLIKITEPNGNQTEYTYDANGNLLTETTANGIIYRYAYDKLSQLISVTDPLGQVTEYTYDNNGNVLTVTDAKGGITSYEYSANGLLAAETNALGNSDTFEYDAAGRLIKYITAAGNVTEYSYDGRGNVLQEKNPAGYVTEYSYDGMGNLTHITSPRGAVTEYEYNNAGLLVAETDALGNRKTKSYSPDGRLLEETLANGLAYTYEYDKLGRIVKVSDSTGLSVSMLYNEKGLLASETNQDNNVKQYSYDTAGQLKSITDSEGAVTEYAYDTRGNLTAIKSSGGADITYQYDSLDRVVNVSQSLMADIEYGYDEVGNTISITQNEKKIYTTYDALGNTLTVTNPLGNVSSYVYDSDNRVIQSTDFAGNTSKVKYDAVGNILTAVNSMGYEWNYSYDSEGNVTEAADALGNITEYSYDLSGNLTSLKTPSGAVTEYSYDSMGNLISKTDAAGRITEYSYDLHDNLIKIVSPDKTVEEFVYDINSRLAKIIKPDGSAIEYDYDSLGKLLSKSYTSENEEYKDVTYGYDSSGNRVTMKDSTGETVYTYDVLGRVTSVTDGSGHRVEYGYDEYGRVNKIIYPEGRVVEYTYDLGDNLIMVQDSDGDSAAYTYDANGNVLTCSRDSGVFTEYGYDSLGQITYIINSQNGKEISSFIYTYNGNGQIITERGRQDGNLSEKYFTYDEQNQLSGYTEIYNGRTNRTTYKYSETGNRIAVTKGENSSTVVYEYDENGRLLRESSSEKGTVEYQYDVNGNLISKSSPNGTITYSYDIENRLNAVREGGELLMAASYDGDGNRVFQINRYTITEEIEEIIPEITPDSPQTGETEDEPQSDKEISDDNIKEPADSSENEGDTPDNEGIVSDNQEDVNKTPDDSNVSDDTDDDNTDIPDINDAIPDIPSEEQEIKTWYEKVYADPEDSIFWYGFGQGILQFLGGSNTALSAYLSDELCRDWNYITDQYELELHSEVQYSDKDIEAMEKAGLSQEDIGAVTERVATYSVKSSDIMIPSKTIEVTHVEYQLTYYVNDINTANEQVLMTYGDNDSEISAYVYGNGRLWEEDCQSNEQNDYIYDGRGSVVQVTNGVDIEMSIIYDPFGNILSGVDENFVGFAYNGEETNQTIGLQYLRARYYDTELGSFLTIDSYLGSLTDIVSQNRYTYANNNPVNNIDPSGHSSTTINGIEQYYDANSLNQIRSYATATALWSAQLETQNAFNNAVATAANTAYENFESINTISQATADSYINNGIAKAKQVSINYGCSTGAIGNAAVERFKGIIEAAKDDANEKIMEIKVSKGVKYHEYLEEVHKQKLEELLESNPPHEGSVVIEPVNRNYYFHLPYKLNDGVLLHLYEIKGILNSETGFKKKEDNPLFEENSPLFGFAWENFGDSEFVGDTTFQFIVNNDILDLASIAWKNALVKMPKPNNIGLGTWAKNISNELQFVDDIIGPASTMAKVVKWVPYAGVVFYTGIDVYENIKSDVPVRRILSDALVDIGIGVGGVKLSSMAGSYVGGRVGGAYGSLAGLAVGAAVSGFVYTLTDVIKINGKTSREWLKHGTSCFLDFIVEQIN